MSSAGRYVQQEKRIAASDSDAIRERWRWGLRLLADANRVTRNGNLKHGVLDELVRVAAARGYRLTEREIQRRLACARAYPTEAQIRHARDGFGSWHDLVQAGFPAVDPPADELPADYRDGDEQTRSADRAFADLVGEQMSLFPAEDFGPLSTLDELGKHVEEMEEMTARYARVDARRRAHWRRLVDAVNGDLAATWEQAERALRNQEPPQTN